MGTRQRVGLSGENEYYDPVVTCTGERSAVSAGAGRGMETIKDVISNREEYDDDGYLDFMFDGEVVWDS